MLVVINRKISRSVCFLLVISAFLTFQGLLFYRCSNVINYVVIHNKAREGIFKEYSTNVSIVLLWNYNLRRLTRNFNRMNCSNKDCLFISDRKILPKKVDAILFNEHVFRSPDRPKNRNLSQLYIFTSTEPPQKAPACDLLMDDFFNWTFTYRLDSSIAKPPFVVYNYRTGHVVAPSEQVNWLHRHRWPPSNIKKAIRDKRKAIAWIPTDCGTQSKQNKYMAAFQEQLYQFSLRVDVYGACSKKSCPKQDCYSMLFEYYFYIVFEEYFAPDFVTERVVDAYANLAVPIVFGGANYSRFLPPTSYLDASVIHPYNLAHTVKNAIVQPQDYEKFFSWRNVYDVETDFGNAHSLCNLCLALRAYDMAPLNNLTLKNFRLWWNGGPGGMKWCLPKDYWNETEKIHGWTGNELLVNSTLFT